MQEALGRVIRGERRQQRLTLKELAEKAHVSTVYLGEVEHGRKYPSASALERLAGALGWEVPDLLEHVAAEMRGEQPPRATRAIGFTVPGPAEETTPHAAARRIVEMLDPADAATMAELGAFFLARRAGAESRQPSWEAGQSPPDQEPHRR